MEKPTFTKKLFKDPYLFTYFFLFFLFLAVSTLFLILEEASFLFPFYLSTSIIMLFLGVYRNKQLNDLFDMGTPIQATIIKLVRFSNTPYLKVEYNYEGETIRVNIRMMTSRPVKNKKDGEKLMVLVHSEKPHRCILISLYNPDFPTVNQYNELDE